MPLESLLELEKRMEKENIKYLDVKGGKHIMMVRQPTKIIDIDNKELLYYTIVKVMNFSEVGEDDERMYYVLLSEDTLNDMVRQVSNSDRNECNLENMYV